MGGGNDEPIDQRAMSGSDDEAPAVADLDNRSIGVAPLHVGISPTYLVKGGLFGSGTVNKFLTARCSDNDPVALARQRGSGSGGPHLAAGPRLSLATKKTERVGMERAGMTFTIFD